MDFYTFLGHMESVRARRAFFTGHKDATIYVRNMPRIIDGVGHKAITLADILVTGPQRQGIFTSLLEDAERYCAEHGLTLFIENVVTERFADFFRRRGYSELPDLAPSFFKRHGTIGSGATDRAR